jgi:hypothetical protein
MAPGGIEPTTFALLARRSNQLSYGAVDVSTFNQVLKWVQDSNQQKKWCTNIPDFMPIFSIPNKYYS